MEFFIVDALDVVAVLAHPLPLSFGSVLVKQNTGAQLLLAPTLHEQKFLQPKRMNRLLALKFDVTYQARNKPFTTNPKHFHSSIFIYIYT